MGFYSLFYNKNREQRKWLIIPTVLVPIAFSIWGILLSQKANDLTVAANNNREQTDTLISIVKKLQFQNELLAKSVRLQEDQVNVNKDQQAYARRPKLSAIMTGSFSTNDTTNVIVQINNSGGNIYHLKYKLSFGVSIDSAVLNYDSQLSAGSKISNLSIEGLRSGSTIQFSFIDELGNNYTQQLKWRSDETGQDLNFGPLNVQSKQSK